MKKYIWLSFIIASVALIIQSGCKKENSELGLNVQPGSDKLNVVRIDTTTVLAYSRLVDSVKTDETSLSVWGAINDPIYGPTKASIYTQFKLTKTAFDWGTDAVLDSLMLTLKYAGSYGDENDELRLKIYELDDTLNYTEDYYSHHTIPIKQTLLADYTFKPNLTDSIVIDGDTVAPMLRINMGALTNELAEKFLAASPEDLNTNDDFLKYFYGLYLSAETTGPHGRMIYFDLVSNYSGMTLYYHNAESDSLKFDFDISASCARFVNFTHDYSLADPLFKSQVLDGDTSLGENLCYLQSMGGVKTYLKFPYLKDYYNDGKLALNEAKIVFKLADQNSYMDPASYLALVKVDTSGGYTILDDQLQGADYYGGYYDSLNNEYYFRITNTVQSLMKNLKPDYGLELYVSGGAVNAERAVIYGTNPLTKPEDRIKLILTYTKLN